MQNDEDWFYLVDDDNGSVCVEHVWHHMNPYKGVVTSEGSKKFSLEDFRTSKEGVRLKDKIDAALGKR